jgi:hypothetical protein
MRKKCAKCVHQNSKPANTKSRKEAVGYKPKFPPDLVDIIHLWPKLPGHIKQSIKALVETSETTDKI